MHNYSNFFFFKLFYSNNSFAILISYFFLFIIYDIFIWIKPALFIFNMSANRMSFY